MIQRWRILRYCCAILGGFLIQLTLGSVYSFGSHGFNCDMLSPNSTTGSSGVVGRCEKKIMHLFLLSMFGSSSTMSLGGYIKDQVGLSFTIIIGSIILNIGVFCSTYAINTSEWTFPVIYGLISGFGAGIMNSVAISASCKHFTHKGLFIGIALSGFSLGPILLSLIKRIAFEFGNYFTTLAVSYLTILIISALLLWISERSSITEYSDNEYSIFRNENIDDIKPHDLIFQYDFWIIWITFLLNSPGSIIMITFQQVINKLEPGILNLNFAFYIYFSVESIGRIFWGFLMDRFSYNNVVAVMTLGSTLISTVNFLFIRQTPVNTISVRLYDTAMILSYFWLAGNYSVFPSIIVKRFGQKYFDKNYGLLWTAYSVAGIITSVTISELDKSLDLEIPCAILSVIYFVSFFLSLPYIGKNRKIHLNILGCQIS